jgi:ubiquitin carboxyl-terminal hydrolase 9/24
MHQPQYVEKLEKILRFLIKEKSLTLKDLDKIWESQMGKHEAIEKNVHDLLSKLAWDFTPEQLDHLFSCFQVTKFLFCYHHLN